MDRLDRVVDLDPGDALAVAALITSTATVAETSRSREMSGSRPLAGSDGFASFARARAAAMNSDGGMVAARHTMTPSPSPGNIRALFACPMRYVVPSRSTGPNGLPVATSAAPSVHSSRFVGVCSASTVGFDIGRMIGRAQCACIDRITFSPNAPVTPDVPTSIVGWRWSTTSCRPRVPSAARQSRP